MHLLTRVLRDKVSNHLNYLFLGYGPIPRRIRNKIFESRENCKILIISQHAMNENGMKVISPSDYQDLNFKDIDIVINSWKTLSSENGDFRRNLLLNLADNPKSTLRFINLSSVAVYGNRTFEVNENTIPEPVNDYGLQKYKLELFIENLKLPFTFNLRISNVFGDNAFDDVINRIFRAHLSSLPLKIHHPDSIKRDFINIESVTEVVCRFMNSLNYVSKQKFLTVNVGSGKTISLFEAIDVLQQLTNKKLNFELIPIEKNTIIQSYVCIDRLSALFPVNKTLPDMHLRSYFSSLLSRV